MEGSWTFRWNEWNVEHIGRHGVTPEMAEEVVDGAASPYPRRIGDDKLLVWGRADDGQALQVIFVMDEDGGAFVLHARPLTGREQQRYRRQER